MFAVIETASGVALHLLEEAPEISEAGMTSPVLAPDIKSGTHSVIEVDAPAMAFVPGLLSVEAGIWFVADQASYDAVMAAQFEAKKSAKLATLAARRWQAETGGIVFMGMSIKTDEDTQRKITGAYVQATRDSGFVVKWKVAPGVFIDLDAAAIIAIGDAVTAHIQACFANEAALTAAILAAGDVAALSAIDIESGWPG